MIRQMGRREDRSLGEREMERGRGREGGKGRKKRGRGRGSLKICKIEDVLFINFLMH